MPEAPRLDLPGHVLELDWLFLHRAEAPYDGWTHRARPTHAMISQPLEGRYKVRCGGETIEVRPGQAFLTAPNQEVTVAHYVDPASKRMRYHCLHLRFTLYGLLDVCTLLDLPLLLGPAATRALSAIITELLEGRTCAEDAGIAALARQRELAFRALTVLCSISRPKENAPVVGEPAARLRRLMLFLRPHLAQPLDVPRMAEAAGLSISGFHRFCNQVLACSPMEYLKSLRLMEACRQLTRSGAKVCEVSASVGFANPYHFSREFSRRFGVPPSRFGACQARRPG